MQRARVQPCGYQHQWKPRHSLSQTSSRYMAGAHVHGLRCCTAPEIPPGKYSLCRLITKLAHNNTSGKDIVDGRNCPIVSRIVDLRRSTAPSGVPNLFRFRQVLRRGAPLIIIPWLFVLNHWLASMRFDGGTQVLRIDATLV